MFCQSLPCQRSDYCGKYGKYFGIYSQCELNQGPCYGDTYCKGSLVCGHWNCGKGYKALQFCVELRVFLSKVPILRESVVIYS